MIFSQPAPGSWSVQAAAGEASGRVPLALPPAAAAAAAAAVDGLSGHSSSGGRATHGRVPSLRDPSDPSPTLRPLPMPSSPPMSRPSRRRPLPPPARLPFCPCFEEDTLRGSTLARLVAYVLCLGLAACAAFAGAGLSVTFVQVRGLAATQSDLRHLTREHTKRLDGLTKRLAVLENRTAALHGTVAFFLPWDVDGRALEEAKRCPDGWKLVPEAKGRVIRGYNATDARALADGTWPHRPTHRVLGPGRHNELAATEHNLDEYFDLIACRFDARFAGPASA